MEITAVPQKQTTEQCHLATLTSTSIRKLTALEDRTTRRTEQAQVGADAAATAADAEECLGEWPTPPPVADGWPVSTTSGW